MLHCCHRHKYFFFSLPRNLHFLQYIQKTNMTTRCFSLTMCDWSLHSFEQQWFYRKTPDRYLWNSFYIKIHSSFVCFVCVLMPLGLQVYCYFNGLGDMGRKVNMALRSPPNTQYAEKIKKQMGNKINLRATKLNIHK